MLIAARFCGSRSKASRGGIIAHRGDAGQARDSQHRLEQRPGDEPDPRRVPEQGVQAGAVEVLHAGQVDDKRTAAFSAVSPGGSAVSRGAVSGGAVSRGGVSGSVSGSGG